MMLTTASRDGLRLRWPHYSRCDTRSQPSPKACAPTLASAAPARRSSHLTVVCT